MQVGIAGNADSGEAGGVLPPAAGSAATFRSTSDRPRYVGADGRYSLVAEAVGAASEVIGRASPFISVPMFDVVERIASYDWEVAEIPTLLKALASTMVDEFELLAAIPAGA